MSEVKEGVIVGNQKKEIKLDETHISLLNFLQERIEQLSHESLIESTALGVALEMLQNKEDPPSASFVLQIIKIFKDSKNQEISSVLNVLKESNKVVIQNNNNNNENNQSTESKNYNLSKEEVDKAKKVVDKYNSFLEMMEDIKKSEN